MRKSLKLAPSRAFTKTLQNGGSSSDGTRTPSEALSLTRSVGGAPRNRTRDAIAEYEGKIAELERKVGQLTMEIDLLKKGRAAGTPAERRELLHRQRPAGCPVARGCRTMKLARSTYYYRPRRPGAREQALQERIIDLCEEFPRYGYRRLTYQLRAEGVLINHKSVARLMRER